MDNKNRISIVSADIGDALMDDLEVSSWCDNIMDYEYAMRDVLRLLNDGMMFSDTFRLAKFEIGGNEYSRSFRCKMTIRYHDEGTRVVSLYYHGDGVYYAYSQLDNGDILRCCFDDHNWRVEDKSSVLHDMMVAFAKEFAKHNK